MAGPVPWEIDDVTPAVPWEIDDLDPTRPAPNAPAPRTTGFGKLNPQASGDFAGDVADVGLGAVSGLAEGLVGLPGIVGDLEQLGRMGINFGASQLGYDEPVSPDPEFKTTGEIVDINRGLIKDATGIDIDYEPTTALGRGAKNVGSVIPGAVLTGPGGVTRGVANMGKNAIVYGVAPTVGAEVAARANEQLGLDAPEWAARLTGAIIGGAGGATAARLGTSVKDRVRGDPVKQLKAESDAFYKRARESGVTIDPTDNAETLRATLREHQPKLEALDPDIHPDTMKFIVKRLKPQLAGTTRNRVVDLENNRQVLRGVIDKNRVTNPADAKAAQELLASYDDYLDSLATAKNATADLKTARRFWTAARRTEEIDDMIQNAKGYAGGEAAGIAAQARTIVKNKTRLRQFSPAQRRMLKDMAKGPGYVSRVLNDAGAGTVGGVVGGTLGSTLGPVGTGVGSVAGFTAGAAAAEAVRSVGRKIRDVSKEAQAARLRDSLSAAALGRREVAPTGGAIERNLRRGYAASQATFPPIERWGNTYVYDEGTGGYVLAGEGER